jgi:HNH endonuclease
MQDCTVCGYPFIPQQRTQRYCSAGCKNRRVRAPRKDTDFRYGNRQCEVCGISYRYSYSKQRTCGRACGGVLNRSERPAAPPKIVAVRPLNDCAWCGRSCADYRHKYCLVPCEQAMHPYASHVSPIGYGTCTECAALFIRRAAWVGAFCSTRCSHRARRRDDKHRRRAAVSTGDRITITALGERDAWRCHLCHRKVSKAMEARGNRPTSPSIDHLHPTSLGGLHVWSNVALAHRACNGKRSNTGAAQLLLDYTE